MDKELIVYGLIIIASVLFFIVFHKRNARPK